MGHHPLGDLPALSEQGGRQGDGHRERSGGPWDTGLAMPAQRGWLLIMIFGSAEPLSSHFSKILP